MLALKSMIGSTAQQFHTYLSHRGEETGNIRGSMRVRVPSERMGTRERLYGNALYTVCKVTQTLFNVGHNVYNYFVIFVFQSGSVWTKMRQVDLKGNPLWYPEWDMNTSSQYTLFFILHSKILFITVFIFFLLIFHQSICSLIHHEVVFKKES